MRGSFWRDRRVLVTGHTGFKGAWLTLWLQHLGARVTGLSLPAEHADGTYAACRPWDDVTEHMVDIRDSAATRRTFRDASPEVVLHLAAQALVRRSYEQPAQTYAINVMGTAHVLDAVRATPSVRAAVVVTSDKVYRNDGTGDAFAEDAPLGQSDPYSSSKAAAELLTDSWRSSFFSGGPRVATARAGNVIGGGDKAADRLVPDALRSLATTAPLQLRFPAAVRPWQHVLEPLHGYLLLAEALATDATAVPNAVNFGPELESCRPVSEVVDSLFRLIGKGSWREDVGHRSEATLLRLDSSLAASALGWRPQLDLETALRWTAEWYRAESAGGNARAIALSQIDQYENLLEERNL